MRTRAIVTSTLASLGVLIVGWQAGATVIATAESATTTTTTASASGVTGSTGSTGSAVTTVVDGTYTGVAASTRWGDVQVAVTISGGAITEVSALQLTDADGKSVQISNRAAPILRDEVIAAQSADVSNVGGATYTTQAYLTSVQSALDQAGF